MKQCIEDDEGQEMSRLCDTYSNFNQVALYEGSKVSLITSSHLHRHSQHFLSFPH